MPRPRPGSSAWSEGRFQFLTRAEVVPGICPAHTETAVAGAAPRSQALGWALPQAGPGAGGGGRREPALAIGRNLAFVIETSTLDGV